MKRPSTNPLRSLGPFLLLLAACGVDAPAPESAAEAPIDPQAVSWIREHAVVLDRTAPGTGLEDFEPLRRILGSSRVVVLGEATHGTREFFQLKHRLVELLVGEMGFELFAMEATGPEAARIEDFVRTGAGDPRELLAGLGYWVWNAREVLDLVLWLREHNRGRDLDRAVGFFGLDMGDPRGAAAALRAYLPAVDPPAAAAAEGALACLEPAATHRELARLYERYRELPQETQTDCRAGLGALHDGLERNRARYMTASSQAAYLRAVAAARVLVQLEHLLRDRSARDRYMAENLLWRLEEAGPAARAVVWTHNGHARARGNSMGRYLRARLAGEVVLVGFTFHDGSFHAVELGERGHGAIERFRAPPLPPDSCERILHAAGLPLLWLDLRTPADAPGAGWLSEPRRLRMIGASYQEGHPERYAASVRLAEEYDALVYVDETRPSTLLAPTRTR